MKVKNLSENEKLTVNSSMSTIRPAPLLLCLIYLNVRDEQSIRIQTYHLKDDSQIELRK